MSERPTLARLLLERERWLDAAARAELARRGKPKLSRSHALVFANVEPGGTRISEIARRAGVSRQAIHQSVSELAEIGLVELAADPTNRSARLVRLTASGRKVDRTAWAVFDELERRLAERIGDREVDRLRKVLSQDWGPP